MKTALDILSMIFLNMQTDNSSIYILNGLLYLAGMYGVFRKCGLKPWHALIPCLREIRVGEAVDLKRADVDTANRIITVDSTFSPTAKRSSSVKTAASAREIFIQDELMGCIDRINAYHRGHRSAYFFVMKDGKRVSYHLYRYHMVKASERLLGRKVTPHVLRHTHTSLLAEAGIPLDDISHRLGHSDSAVTRAVYLHVTERMKEKENERIKRLKLL